MNDVTSTKQSVTAASGLVVLASAQAQPTLTMNVVAGDDVINATEATADVAVSGSSRG